MSKKTKNTKPATKKQTAPKAAAKPTQNKKADKPKSVVPVEKPIVIPGIGGGGDLQTTVTLFQVAPHVIEDLRKRGAELSDEQVEQLFAKRKEATAWIKAQRAALKGVKAATGGAGAKALYRASKTVAKVLEGKASLSEEQHQALKEAQDVLEGVAAALGFDAAKYETQQAQKAMAREKAKKEAANA